MKAPTLTSKARRSLRYFGLAAVPVFALAGGVQATGAGIDILVVATAALLLFGLERTVGDLFGEWLGPLASAAVLVVVVLALSWYFLSESLGRSRTDRFFAEAERRGYTTVYYQRARSTADDPVVTKAPPPVSQPVATGGNPVSVAAPGTEAAGTPPQAVDSENGDARSRSASQPRASGQGSSVGRIFRSLFRRNTPPAVPTGIAVSVAPSRVAAAHRAVITASVRSEAGPVTWGVVEFMINGLGGGRVQLNADGIASTTFQTHIPGSYEVVARFAGSLEYAPSRSKPVHLNVYIRR